MKKDWINIPIHKLTEPIETVDPRKTPNSEFKYIDVSSVSRVALSITESTTLMGAEAPSRARRLVRNGDVIFATIRPTLKRIAQVTPDLDGSVCSTGFFVLRPKDIVLSRYLFYWLLGKTFSDSISKLQRGASYPAVSDSDVKNQNILLPPLRDQKHIVAVLDEAFAGIDAVIANTENNLANARELFESYLSVVLCDREGWLTRKIGDVCDLKSGTTVKKSLEQLAGDIAYLKVSDMSLPGNEEIITSSSKFLSTNEVKRQAIFPAGTTIFPKRGGAIATNKKRLTAIPICADLNIMGVIPSEALHPKFLYFYFLGKNMRELGGGSSIPQINNYDIAPLEISFPRRLKDQRRIAQNLEGLLVETNQIETIYQRKVAALAELKQSMLHKAFYGSLTMDKVEKLAEGAIA